MVRSKPNHLFLVGDEPMYVRHYCSDEFVGLLALC